MYKAKFAGLLRELPAGISQVGRVRVVRSGGCMRADCPDCHTDVSVRRGKRIKARLDIGRNAGPVGETTFTVPPRLRGRFVSSVQFRAARRAAWKILKQLAGAKFGVGCSHPVGDKNPEIFHPHIHFLWVGEAGFLGFLPPETMKRIRESWRDWLNAVVVDVHHGYTQGDEDGKLFHRCRYVGRSFPGFGAWCGSVAWFGTFPKKIVLESDKLCPKCKQNVRVIGSATRAEFELFRATGEASIPEYMLNHGWTGVIPEGASNGPPYR